MQNLIYFKLFFLILLCRSFNAQTNPVITAWAKSTGTGYSGIKANITKIQYSSNYVYISAASIPGYSIGPWSNPNTPSDMQFIFKFPLNPTEAATKTTVPLGHVGLWLNGVSIYNADDGQTYNSLGVWRRNAYVFEGSSFDSCKGHADVSKEYHHHVSPKCFYDYTATSVHSPILGFAFDGFPIYGPYGYSTATDSTSGIKKLVSGYKTRTITDRTTLSNGTTLTSTYYGPTLTEYKIGSFLEDYEFSSLGADLDIYNGRYCKTPEYTSGTYAYFVNVDSSGDGVYPFVIGASYYGNVISTNLGSGSGKSAVSETTTVYFDSGTNRIDSSLVFKLLIPLNFILIFKNINIF